MSEERQLRLIERLDSKGGPAFPVSATCDDGDAIFIGMSLRDWLMGQLLAAIARDHLQMNDRQIVERAEGIADLYIRRRNGEDV